MANKNTWIGDFLLVRTGLVAEGGNRKDEKKKKIKLMGEMQK